LLFPILIIAIIGVLLFFFASIFINPLIDFAKSQLHLLG
jgi:hypothetical protein